MLSAMAVTTVQELVGQSRYDALAADVLAYLLNVGFFGALIRVWYRRASEERYVIGALGITAAYLISYFLLLPTVNCP
jgi:hypothetical protein